MLFWSTLFNFAENAQLETAGTIFLKLQRAS